MNRARPARFVLLLFFLAGCPNSTTSTCPDLCPRGQICDDGLCVPLERPLVDPDRTIGGVGIDVAVTEDWLFVSAIDPAEREVLVTSTGEQTETRIVHTFGDSVGTRTAIAANSNRVGLVWREASRYVYASRPIAAVGAFWDVEEVDGEYEATEHFDLALDATDAPHIVFADARGSLNRASRESTGWEIDLVDDGGPTRAGRGCADVKEGRREVGLDPSVLLSGGTFTVAYFDDVCGDLRIARFVDDAWVSDIVDEGLDVIQSELDRVGRFSSIAREPGGNLRISYFDEARGRLMLAAENDGQFEISVIDEGLQIDNAARTRKLVVGAFSSIAIRPDGRQQVVYYDATNGALRAARRDAGDDAWTVETLDQNNLAGMYARVVARGSTFLVAYQRLTPSDSVLISEQVQRELSQ